MVLAVLSCGESHVAACLRGHAVTEGSQRPREVILREVTRHPHAASTFSWKPHAYLYRTIAVSYSV